MVGVSQLSRIIAYRDCPFDHDLSKGNEWINERIYSPAPLLHLPISMKMIDHRSSTHNLFVKSGAIIGDGDRKSWDARGPMIWDNFSIFRTNCAILTSYIRANPRTCRGFSRGCCHVAGSNLENY